MYFPRSRGLMMSAMMTWLRAARPPAPMPCTARNAIIMLVSCEKPAAAVARTKIAIAIWMSSLRLNRSASLPQIGRGDRGRQQRRGDDPGEGGLVALEVVDDDRQRGRDDRRCEHRHEHAEEEARQGGEHFARGARSALDRGGRGG